MPVFRLLRFLLLPAALVVAMELLRLSLVSLQQAFHKGFGEGLMMAWVLLLVAGSAAGALGRRRMRRKIIPSLGVKIP